MSTASEAMNGIGLNANGTLVAINVGWLRQALSLIEEIDGATFASSPKQLTPHRIGSHLRHVLEFYQCFLNGVQSGHIDYDARQRNETVENNRHTAAERIRLIINQLEQSPTILEDSAILVRVENPEETGSETYLRSSVGRELQALSSHTIHHFALIAVTLRGHGFHVDPDFGMSPSTLRYRASHTTVAASEAA